MNLPLFEMIIDPLHTSDVEVAAIAFVDKPAIERNFLAFNGQRLEFAVNAERHVVSGPAMVPDTPIYRRDENGEYNVYFSRETIEQIVLKFMKKDYHKNLNLFHDPKLAVAGVTIFESFISDSARGVAPMKGYEDLPDGTWFISAKVENEEVWNKIKSGEVKGFSIEGIFHYLKKPKAVEEQIYELLNRTVETPFHLTDKSTIMASIKEMLAGLKKGSEKFFGEPVAPPAPAPAPVQVLNQDYKLKDGTAVTIDKLEVGGVVMIGPAPAAAGVHELEDGTKITVGEGGVITAVEVVQQQQAPGVNMEEVRKEIADQLKAFTEKLSAVEKLNTQQSEKITEQDKLIKGLFEVIEKLADVPTADPAEAPNAGIKSPEALNKEERRKRFIEAFHKSKN